MPKRTFEPISLHDLSKKIEEIEDDTDWPTRITPDVEKDLSKVEFDLENVMIDDTSGGDNDDMHDLMGYRQLKNGLSILGVFAGGDWEFPVYFIIYWDGKKLRGYIPTNGNPWNTDTKQAYGNNPESDSANSLKRYGIEMEEPACDADFEPDKILDDIFKRFESSEQKQSTVKSQKAITEAPVETFNLPVGWCIKSHDDGIVVTDNFNNEVITSDSLTINLLKKIQKMF